MSILNEKYKQYFATEDPELKHQLKLEILELDAWLTGVAMMHNRNMESFGISLIKNSRDRAL